MPPVSFNISLANSLAAYLGNTSNICLKSLVSILRYRINQMLTGVQNRGYMYMDEKLDLADLFQAYTSLGGNSRTHDWYMEVIHMYKVHDRIRSEVTIPPSKEAIDIIHESSYRQTQEIGQKHQK